MSKSNTEDTARAAGEPTTSQLALAKFADEAENTGLKTSMYYTLYPQILEARAAIAIFKKATGETS